MKNVLERVAKNGATFTNAFTSSPICCPSRAALLSGQYAHNCATVNNSMAGGCYGTFWKEHVEQRTIAAVAQSIGLETFFAGKYLNQFHGTAVPPKWSQFFGLIGNSKYQNYSLNENGRIVQYTDEYLTDVLRAKAENFLNTATKPFFMYVAPPAPHSPFTPAARHEERFPEVKAERTPNFNVPSEELDKHWLLTMEPKQLPANVLENIDVIARKRWQSLLAVDEMVGSILDILEERNILDNTYIIFTSDNGYHLGQFAQAYDKRQPYETDVRIPLVIRGPKIPKEVVVDQPTLLIDLFPTLQHIWNLSPFQYLDGRSFYHDLVVNEPQQQLMNGKYDRKMLIEHWGEFDGNQVEPACGIPARNRVEFCTVDAACHCQDSWNNTYACVRHLSSKEDNILYCLFKDRDNFVEIYDLSTDPHEMRNIASEMLPSLQTDYRIKLSNLANCLGDKCKQYDGDNM